MAGKAARVVYGSRVWAFVRWLVFERDGWRCVECGRKGRLEVDHIRPIARGGAPLDPANLRTLCRGCHVEITAKQNRKPPAPERLVWDRLVEAL